MTYYISPAWVYLINVFDWLHLLLLFFGISTIFLSLISLLAYLVDDNERKYAGLIVAFIIAGIVATFASAFIPSKSTSIEILIASKVTQENASGAREEIYNIIDYVTDKINGAESEEQEERR